MRHIVGSDTRRIGNVEIRARLEYGDAGGYDLSAVRTGRWSSIVFDIVNHGRRRFVFIKHYARIEFEGGGRFAANQGEGMPGTLFAKTFVNPRAKSASVRVGPYGYRIGVWRIVYAPPGHLLTWDFAPNTAAPTADTANGLQLLPPYTITDLGTLGGAKSGATAINDSGDVAGWAETAASHDGLRSHAFLWRSGSMIDLGEGQANAINQSGCVVGGMENKAFLYQEGKVQYLQVDSERPAQNNNQNINQSNTNADAGRQGKSRSAREREYRSSYAVALNDRGQIVGGATTTDGQEFLWLWQAGRVSRLTSSSERMAFVSDINNKGHVVGQRNGHPWLYADGKWLDLGTLGGPTGSAYYINDADEVVGYADTNEWYDTGDDRAGSSIPLSAPFVWQNGKMTRLAEQYGPRWQGKFPAYGNDKMFSVFPYVPDGRGGLCRFTQLVPAHSGWTQLRASAINRKGQIVGTGEINGNYRAFLLSPAK